MDTDTLWITPAEMARRAKAAGTSLAAICSRLGISRTTVWQWQAGSRSPSLRTYRLLYEALHLAEACAAAISALARGE